MLGSYETLDAAGLVNRQTDAIASAEELLKGKHDAENFPAPTLEWFAKDDGSIALTHVFQVRNEAEGTWVEAFVDATSGEVVSITDFVAKASVSRQNVPAMLGRR